MEKAMFATKKTARFFDDLPIFESVRPHFILSEGMCITRKHQFLLSVPEELVRVLKSMMDTSFVLFGKVLTVRHATI